MTIEDGIKLLNKIGMKELGLQKTRKTRPYFMCLTCQRKVKKLFVEIHKRAGHEVVKRND